MDRSINNSKIRNSQDHKPIKVLLEVILNRKKVLNDVPVRMTDLNSTLNTLNSSVDSAELLEESIISNHRNTSINSSISRKRKTYEIKIKLNVSDIDDFNEDAAPEEEAVAEEELKEADLLSNERVRTEATMKKISSTVSLTVKDDKDDVISFDVNPTQEDPSAFIPDVNDSHNQSFWSKIFDKIKSNDQTSRDEKRVVKIIHDLITEKYKQALTILKYRFERRENRSKKHNKNPPEVEDNKSVPTAPVENRENENQPAIEEKPIVQEYPENISILDVSNDKLLDFSRTRENPYKSTGAIPRTTSRDSHVKPNARKCASEDLILLETSHEFPSKNTVDDFVQYDSSKFLQAALGDYANSSFESLDAPYTDSRNTMKTEQSIGSSNVSVLLSDSEEKNLNAPLYSTVKKCPSKREKGRVSAKYTKTSNDYGYESFDDLAANDYERKLMNDNVRQNEIIHQISKAVHVCRAHSRYFGQEMLLEAEKVLLLASLKRAANNEELKRLDYEEIEHRQATSAIIVKNIEFYAKFDWVSDKSFNRYYICVVRQGGTVFATNVLLQQDKTIAFPEKFNFKGLSPDFEMYISLYGLELKNRKDKKAKLHSQLKTIPSTHSTTSYFVLWGTASVKPWESNQTIFTLSNVAREAPIKDILRANIETYFTIHVKEAGFLTLGSDYKGFPIWNRRWCSLNGSRLSYWNYPKEEEHCSPLGELDLLKCLSYDVVAADKEICPNPRTLVINMKTHEEDNTCSSRRYFLAADNTADFKRWEDSLNVVFSYLNKWKNYECFLDN